MGTEGGSERGKRKGSEKKRGRGVRGCLQVDDR